jgi:hypothetical protein
METRTDSGTVVARTTRDEASARASKYRIGATFARTLSGSRRRQRGDGGGAAAAGRRERASSGVRGSARVSYELARVGWLAGLGSSRSQPLAGPTTAL